MPKIVLRPSSCYVRVEVEVDRAAAPVPAVPASRSARGPARARRLGVGAAVGAEREQLHHLAAPAAAPIDPATAASVSGTVKLDGTAPKAAKIDMSQDPACKGTNTAETIVADGGNLANVFVYVKDGLGDRTFAVPTQAVTIDQQGCKYHPHVLGAMVGQNIEIKNDDPTTHNIHPTPQANREWNESQPPQAAPIEKSFAREEIMLPVKCNQHPWMRMYINVVKSPFYAVTGKKNRLPGTPQTQSPSDGKPGTRSYRCTA